MTEFAIGQDSHAFEKKYDPSKPLTLGGYVIPDAGLTLKANSDGDVILHAITNAVSGITCKNILGAAADELCKSGVTDSAEYLALALQDLKASGRELVRISLSVEAKKPKLAPHIENIRSSIASITHLAPESVGITATSGEGLSAFGRGLGIQVFCAVTVSGR